MSQRTTLRRVSAAALAACLALGLAACGGVSDGERRAADDLVATVESIPGVQKATLVGIQNSSGVGPTKSLTIAVTADAPTADALAATWAAVHAALRDAEVTKRHGYQSFGDVVATLDGAATSAHFDFRDPDPTRDAPGVLAATLPEAKAVGGTIIYLGGVPRGCQVDVTGVALERVVEVALAPLPGGQCSSWSRHVSHGDNRRDTVPDTPGPAGILLDARPGTTPGPLPVEAWSRLLAEPTFVNLDLTGAGTYVVLTPHRRLVLDASGEPSPVPGNDDPGPLPERDAAAAALRAIKDHPGDIKVEMDVPIAITITGGRGTLTVRAQDNAGVGPADKAFLDLYQQVAATL